MGCQAVHNRLKELSRQASVLVAQIEETERKSILYSDRDWEISQKYWQDARELDMKLLDIYEKVRILEGK